MKVQFRMLEDISKGKNIYSSLFQSINEELTDTLYIQKNRIIWRFF